MQLARPYLLALGVNLSLLACSGSNSADTNDEPLTGKRFFDSAASKFISASPGMTRRQANCIVSAMTESGEIGLGEINAMRSTENGLSGRERRPESNTRVRAPNAKHGTYPVTG